MRKVAVALLILSGFAVLGCSGGSVSSSDQEDFANAGLSKEQIEANKNQSMDDRSER
jgi:hypothetical protein